MRYCNHLFLFVHVHNSKGCTLDQSVVYLTQSSNIIRIKTQDFFFFFFFLGGGGGGGGVFDKTSIIINQTLYIALFFPHKGKSG